MRGASRRTGELMLVSPVESFGWDAFTIATLRHCSLPWYEAAGPPMSLPAIPLPSIGPLGTRDRLSLLAQFAAHEAFLQFAGIADCDFSTGDWAVIRKRGTDCRLVRTAARPPDPEAGPPVLSLVQEFAKAIGSPELPVFRQSWARAETAYFEVDEMLRLDVAADLRWMRRSACGEVLSPGPDVLRELWRGGFTKQTWNDPSVIEALTIAGSLDRSRRAVTLSCEFPLHRYGALEPLDPSLPGSVEAEAVVADRIAAIAGERRHLVVAGARLDVASRNAIDIASSMGTATWLMEADASDLPPTRWFVVATRVNARRLMEDRLKLVGDPRPWLEAFVESPAYRAYLATGDVPLDDTFSRLPEPKRSYVAALALLGSRVPLETARAFLRDFSFDQPLEDLCFSGLTRLEDEQFNFESETVRDQCARHIPPGSRAVLCRAAATAAHPARAAFLLIEAGDVGSGMAKLETLPWQSAEQIVEQLGRLPAPLLTSPLVRLLAEALVDCGRYRDAASISGLLEAADQELLLARCDRRSGDYDTALARLDRLDVVTFRSQILEAEILRVCGRLDEAIIALAAVEPAGEEELIHAAYEGSLVALECGRPADAQWTAADHYLAARFLTYRALTDSDFASAEQLAGDALRLARSPIERIDARLDLVFSTFSAGRWNETRIAGLEALKAIEDTQGDRAAAGILFTLTYLAADNGQWRAADAMLGRLRHYYSALKDNARLFELKLLDAHLLFSRGLFADARHLARQVLDRDHLLPQVREAAALIIDEANAIDGLRAGVLSTGGSGNRELTDRHRLVARRLGHPAMQPELPFNEALWRWETGQLDVPSAPYRSASLKLMRAALCSGRDDVASRMADSLGLELASLPEPARELEMLRLAATADFPFDGAAFGSIVWAHASRNRFGNWSVTGNREVSAATLDQVHAAVEDDWIRSGQKELLFIEGCHAWTPSIRDAIAAIFRTRAENQRLRRLVEQQDDSPAPLTGLHGMIGESPAIRAVLDSIARVARRDVAVCISGESGSGKELVARAVHRESSRRQKAFVAVNCAALPENLIESELFGHVRGAFTGAERDRAGLIETSDGGTLFLDEIGEMPLVAQAKLLRFLQDGEFRRVGEAASRSSDVRVISATNRRLESAVEEGRFREDLYYRIRGVEITVPPLRERGNDVMLLARHFLAEERTRHRGGAGAISADVELLLRSYRWPGNVRELQNALRAAHAMAGDAREIAVEHLPERLRSVVPARVMAGSYQEEVARFRRDLIERSLREAGGNQNRAAALLNISRQALAYQIRELGILVRKPAMPSM